MSGDPILDFVLLNEDAVEWSQSVLDWVWGWCGALNVQALTPEEWFTRGQGLAGGDFDPMGVWVPNHEIGTHLWCPPPAVAEAAVDELLRAKHKRPESMHVFVCPCLLTCRWRKQLQKVLDLTFEVPAGTFFWPHSMDEPLVVSVSLPFISHRPWQLQGCPRLVGLGRALRGMWQEEERDMRALLRQLCVLLRRLAPLSADVVWGVLHSPHTRSIPRA